MKSLKKNAFTNIFKEFICSMKSDDKDYIGITYSLV